MVNKMLLQHLTEMMQLKLFQSQIQIATFKLFHTKFQLILQAIPWMIQTQLLLMAPHLVQYLT